MQYTNQHHFYIPVMGLAYTIDSPAKVARYGIGSVISIVEDQLIEMMRKHYYPIAQKSYFPITTDEPDYRSHRITDYLNLVNTIVQQQVERIKNAAFEAGSEIVKYFSMLPEDSPVKQLYRQMTGSNDPSEKEKMETYLRSQITPGSIDVNIMTKLDRNKYDSENRLIEEGSDAITALKGYAESNLSNSSVVFSAGMNPRLYNYLENCKGFEADANGQFTKKVIIKVSDFRSALVQGKFLAKKGIWVSEFRIESGLNCGGHAFATDGFLMGPILEEFALRREELVQGIFEIYNQAIMAKGHQGFSAPHAVKITAQGGIGTFEEARFLRSHYGMDHTGWGTPFLLVPEATTVDDETLEQLSKAGKDDVFLSKHSPLGIRFHYLKGTSSDLEKQERIQNGKPGSPCTEKFLSFNTEFTEQPICTASKKYQQLKIKALASAGLPEREYKKQLSEVLEKECLCVGLSNAAAKVYDLPFVKNLESVTICPGPNIAYFSRVVSLQTMTDHIYGRSNIVTDAPARPHMFIAELNLYLKYLKEELENDEGKVMDKKRIKYYTDFSSNLTAGIRYYREVNGIAESNRELFLQGLAAAEKTLHRIIENSPLLTVAPE